LTNRFLLDSNGLKISTPGVDVLGEDLRYLAFTSRHRIPKVFLSASVTLSINNAYFGQTGVVPYGRTFSRMPTIFYYLQTADGLCITRHAFRTTYGSPNTYYSSFVSSIGRSGVSFLLRTPTQSSSTNTVHYIVLEDD